MHINLLKDSKTILNEKDKKKRAFSQNPQMLIKGWHKKGTNVDTVKVRKMHIIKIVSVELGGGGACL